MAKEIKWEYKIVETFLNGTVVGERVHIGKKLNELGQDGWENYAVDSHRDDSGVSSVHVYYYFKRILK